jgi:pyruvate, water dikinase
MSAASRRTRPRRSAPFALVRPLHDLRREDLTYAGGKGANLGELIAAEMPVPRGFVVGAPAFATFADESGLRGRLRERFEGLDPDDVDALAAAAEDARELVLAEALPEAVGVAIRRHYADLAETGEWGPMVAVRSSATTEDTESASFAGIHETVLNVHGADAVLDAVRRCWASLFGARTLAYRAGRGLPLADLDIAVVVQRQIVPTRSGVMFTIDPATGDTDRLVIEGSLGLGEPVVAGEVSPDRFVVDKDTRTVSSFQLGRKEVVVEPLREGGVRRRPATLEEAGAAVLSDEDITVLADLAIAIEGHYGAPQDTEWAVR